MTRAVYALLVPMATTQRGLTALLVWMDITALKVCCLLACNIFCSIEGFEIQESAAPRKKNKNHRRQGKQSDNNNNNNNNKNTKS